jgi:hypothetical protein
MELNECIICFEDFENEYVYELFECNHKDNMHIKCIYELDKCPLCRAPRKTSVHISVIIVQCQQFHSVCFYFSICVYVILVMLILDGYENVKYMINDKMLYNDTYALDYI